MEQTLPFKNQGNDSIEHKIIISCIQKNQVNLWVAKQSAHIQQWVKSFDLKADNAVICLPNCQGSFRKVLYVPRENPCLWDYAEIPRYLPFNHYTLDETFDGKAAYEACLAWGLEVYAFSHFKKRKKKSPVLILPNSINKNQLHHEIEAIYLVRDLINRPANDLNPTVFANVAKKYAKSYKATCKITSGKKLEEDFPAIHAVGKAASDPPCLIDIQWGNITHPKVTLVGKGVCFDTGGLDLKPSQYMKLMKKDMGGAAHVLGLGSLIMSEKWPIALRILIPIVENSIASNSYRPQDIIQTRKGLTVEIGNTDAEGRLILADALTLACEDNPELIIDMATLTGAARVAMGTEIPALFSTNENIGEKIVQEGKKCHDPLWQMPLWEPYQKFLASQVADLNNIGSSPYGGAITAALFLKKFLDKKITWVHIDLMGWNISSSPGRPEGGEAMGIRGIFKFLEKYYHI